MLRPVLLAAVSAAALALGGCGAGPATPTSPEQALRNGAHMSEAARVASRRMLRELCPKAARNAGRDLTQAEAKRCLGRAWNRYRQTMRRYGFDPEQVADQ
jgi:xanthine dehydrogenase iron-sulfur cluster and FAD-binding subunit A